LAQVSIQDSRFPTASPNFVVVAMACCNVSAKWLKATNSILLLLALVALSVGIVSSAGLIKEKYPWADIMGDSAWGGPFLIAAGAFTFMVACLGYGGAVSKQARCLLFPYFVALLILFCLLVGTVATAFAIGGKEEMRAYVESRCEVTPRPQWCGTPDQFDEVVDTILNNLKVLAYGSLVACGVIFLNMCSAYKVAANSDDKQVMACCDGIAKRWLKLTDICLLIVSLVMIGLGAYALYEKNEEGEVDVYTWAAPFIIAVGAFTFVLSVCGYVGAKTSKARALLFPYFVALLVLFGLLVAVVAATHSLE